MKNRFPIADALRQFCKLLSLQENRVCGAPGCRMTGCRSRMRM